MSTTTIRDAIAACIAKAQARVRESDGGAADAIDNRAQRVTDASGWFLSGLPDWPVSQPADARRRVMHSAIRRAVDSWRPRRHLILVGPTGSGKSVGAAHAVIGIMERWIARGCPGRLPPVRWCQVTALERARREHPLGAGEAPLIANAMRARLAIIDDLGQEPSRGDTALWDIIDARYSTATPTIITTGLSPDELSERYGAAFVRRMSQDGCAVVGDAFGACGVRP